MIDLQQRFEVLAKGGWRMPDGRLASPECTNHSLAKGGKRRKPQASSLFDDGPAGDDEQERSRATMWDVCRFAEQKLLKGKPYKAIVVENVVDAFKWGYNDDGGLFRAWLTALDALGYHHEVVWLNSMFCWPTPQSRDRMYIVFWRKGVKAPNLRFEPAGWCPACERIVDGRQTWKKPDRPWGRYGAQYFFTCPSCNGAILPGVFPAATAIDWSLPAGRIGERDRPLAPATRERIRRGLEKLAREPFAVRLTHGSAPRPLTLPMVTLTQRHDMAMVTPVAGNTFERTPGNRARDAAIRPLDTVHGTLDRAVVVPAGGSWSDAPTLDDEPLATQATRESKAVVLPPMGDVAPRDADTAPAPTQPTTTRPALVMANTENNVPRPAEREPAQTLRSQGGLAMLLANRANNVPRDADREAAAPVLTGPTLAVVMRNNNHRGDPGEMTTPTHEPIRTLTTAGNQSLLIPYAAGNETGISERDPAPTLTTGDRLALVVPFTNNGRARDADTEPAPTATGQGPPAVVLTEEDIDDCRFRMFDLHEIAAAMAFADDYVVLGNKRERMAQYGNAVTPPAMRMLVGRILEVIE